jgi:hypothetical protein
MVVIAILLAPLLLKVVVGLAVRRVVVLLGVLLLVTVAVTDQ